MQRLLNANEVAQIDAKFHDNALLQACRRVWPERSAEVTSVVVCAEDIFCEVAWLTDELIETDRDAEPVSLISGLWTVVTLDIARWGNQVSIADRYLIVSTVFRIVVTAFSLHWDSYYCDNLRDAMLDVIEKKRPVPKDLHESQEQQRQREELFEATIACSDILSEWVNYYIDNPNICLTDEIELALNPPIEIKTGKPKSRKADKKSNSDYSRYSFLLNVKGKRLEDLYVMLSKRDDKGKRLIDGDLKKNNKDDMRIEFPPETKEEIKNTAINKMLFNQVFSGQETDVRIVWTGDAVELWYFIYTLHHYKVNGKRLLDKSGSGPGIWKIVHSRFLNGKTRKVLDERTGKEVETSEPIEFDDDAFNHYSKKNSLKDTSTLDAIIRKIAPPRDKNDEEAINDDLNPMNYGIKPPTSVEQLEGDFRDTNHHGKNQ